jgi:hypothetical protein
MMKKNINNSNNKNNNNRLVPATSKHWRVEYAKSSRKDFSVRYSYLMMTRIDLFYFVCDQSGFTVHASSNSIGIKKNHQSALITSLSVSVLDRHSATHHIPHVHVANCFCIGTLPYRHSSDTDLNCRSKITFLWLHRYTML